MILSKNFIKLITKEGDIEVTIDPTDKEYKDLKKLLPKLTNRKGTLIIME
ncbi:MAG: hypothetical protein ABFR05_13605 [Bacteroidota bacterium]